MITTIITDTTTATSLTPSILKVRKISNANRPSRAPRLPTQSMRLLGNCFRRWIHSDESISSSSILENARQSLSPRWISLLEMWIGHLEDPPSKRVIIDLYKWKARSRDGGWLRLDHPLVFTNEWTVYRLLTHYLRAACRRNPLSTCNAILSD